MDLSAALSGILEPRRILTRHLDLIAYAGDASFYRLVPKAVVQPENTEEVRALFAWSRETGIPLTFRAAGTSLSGQAVTDGVLVDLSKGWRNYEILDDGGRIRVQPGLIGAHVNALLKPFRRKIGPDPASISACMIGGIIANNASGMCCGTRWNSYHTVESLTFVLPDGLTLDTGKPDANDRLVQQRGNLARTIVGLRERILANPRLVDRIREKYRIKNTVGYALNAFLDYEAPADILGRLMVGSEGTLGFIAEAVFQTIPDFPYKYTGLLVFNSVADACAALPMLKESGAAAIELMDRAALRSVENQAGAPALIRTLPASAAALLVEYQCSDPHAITNTKIDLGIALHKCRTLAPPIFTEDPREQAALWKIRKGMYPSVGAARALGTAVIIEDVAVPVERLADAVADLHASFQAHGYPETIIFGHAKDGNIHFVMTQSFNDVPSVRRYERFMAELVETIVGKYDGSLKAEHGTGRNMAPFVETEWGAEGYAIMRELKAAVDPANLLNPDVIINPDPRAHLRDLKPLPVVEPEVDKCIECGFCEHVCPSAPITLTPRQRIAARREMARLREGGDARALAALAVLEKEYRYAGLDTCATDGLCATVCPVNINTGDLVKHLRADGHDERALRFAARIAARLPRVETLARLGIRTGHLVGRLLGDNAIPAVTRRFERYLGTTLPKWNPHFATVARLPRTSRAEAEAVYFPACVSRLFGQPVGKLLDNGQPEHFVTVARRAGIEPWIPSDVSGVCCGMPFLSKGYLDAGRETLNAAVEKFWEWSKEGKLPVVVDASSCSYTLRSSAEHLTPENRKRMDRLAILDGIEFVHDTLLPRLSLRKVARSVVLHPVCSVVKLGIADKLTAVAAACAERVDVPLDAGCCAFAGDRGLLFPELTAAAAKREAAEVLREKYEGYYSSNPMCETGMRHATGKPYRSFISLVEQATRF